MTNLVRILGTALLCALPTVALAQEKSKADELADVLAKRQELVRKLQGLQQEYRSAEPARQQQIATEFQELAGAANALTPQMEGLAKAVFAEDKGNVQAGQILLQKASQENDYETIIKIADGLKSAGKESALVANLAGVSYFAKHDFEKAQKTLERAKALDQQGFSGEPFLEACEDYLEYWPKEQTIRAQEAAANDLPRVKLSTSQGDIVVELFENQAPNTVANFISLVESKTYDGTRFHRVIPNFMAQGGDPLSTDDNPQNDGTGGPGYQIACECYTPDTRMHFQGSLSMAHAGRDTGGSQFFITHLPTPDLNGKHTVFGRVIEGLDVALKLKKGDQIKSAVVIRKRDHEYVPEKR